MSDHSQASTHLFAKLLKALLLGEENETIPQTQDCERGTSRVGGVNIPSGIILELYFFRRGRDQRLPGGALDRSAWP